MCWTGWPLCRVQATLSSYGPFLALGTELEAEEEQVSAGQDFSRHADIHKLPTPACPLKHIPRAKQVARSE